MHTTVSRRPPGAAAIALALLAVVCGACGGEDGQQRPPAPGTAPADSGTHDAAETTGPRTPPPGGEGDATIAGRIRYEGPIPKLPSIDMAADPGCAKKHEGRVTPDVLVLGEDRQLANVFVRVVGGLPQGRWPAPSTPVELDQQGCRYQPHVLGVMAGQTLEILNSDELLHNIHALPDRNSEFNRAMPASVESITHTFAEPEFMFRIKCDVHPWMGAWVAVMEHPFFAVTDEDGRYEIGGLPAGTYEIEAWHEKLDTRTASVTVTDGETGSADFTFTR